MTAHDFDSVLNGNFDYNDDEYGTRGYPKIWWFNGVRQAGTAGHFYTSEKEFPNGLGKPWQPVSRFNDADGFVAETLNIIPIRKRYQPFKKDPMDSKRKIWYPANAEWEVGMTIYTEILCFMEGYDGLVVLAVKGMTGKALTNRVDGVFKRHADGVLTVAKKTAKKGAKIPPYMFWVPITCKRTKNGKVDYQDTGHSSTITPPDLGMNVDDLTREDIKPWYVGGEMLEKAKEAYESHAEWRREQRASAIEVQQTSQAPTQTQQGNRAQPPRNVPQPAVLDDDDDLPY